MAETAQFLNAPSDLINGVYEGGLKTWECSLDMASYLDALVAGQDSPWQSVLEVCRRCQSVDELMIGLQMSSEARLWICNSKFIPIP